VITSKNSDYAAASLPALCQHTHYRILTNMSKSLTKTNLHHINNAGENWYKLSVNYILFFEDIIFFNILVNLICF